MWETFYLFLSSVNYIGFTLFFKKKSALCRNVLSYPESEAMAFPENEIESTLFMFTLSMTR